MKLRALKEAIDDAVKFAEDSDPDIRIVAHDQLLPYDVVKVSQVSWRNEVFLHIESLI